MVRHGKATGGGVVSFLPEDKGQQEVSELRASLADTINELEKTRQLLQMQHTINKEYKSEVHVLSRRTVTVTVSTCMYHSLQCMFMAMG